MIKPHGAARRYNMSRRSFGRLMLSPGFPSVTRLSQRLVLIPLVELDRFIAGKRAPVTTKSEETANA